MALNVASVLRVWERREGKRNITLPTSANCFRDFLRACCLLLEDFNLKDVNITCSKHRSLPVAAHSRIRI